MRRTVIDPRFRGLLINLLRARDITQHALADQAYMSPSYLSQIINGQRMPSEEVAKTLDDALHAGGQLAALVTLAGRAEDLDTITAAAGNPRQVNAATIESMHNVLRAQRYLDDTMGSAAVLAPTVAQLDIVTRMVRAATGTRRPPVLHMAAQWAQFCGWLHTSTGQRDGARHWFSYALEWSVEHGDRDLIATVLSYQAHLAWLGAQTPTAVGLAHAALRDPLVYPGQRAYDAYAAARGHAELGDLTDARRLAGEAHELALASVDWVGPVLPWQYYRAPWFWALEDGLFSLTMAVHDTDNVARHAATAVDRLRTGLDGIPEEMRGADWAAEYMFHLGRAYIYGGAFVSARETLADARRVATATRSRRVLHMIERQERRIGFTEMTG